MYIRPSRERQEETEDTAPDAPTPEAEETEKGILIDLEKQTLHERKGECVTREEIKQRFWNTDDNASEKIDTHIKTIRKILKDFPGYQVMTVRGKGYYLYEERNTQK